MPWIVLGLAGVLSRMFTRHHHRASAAFRAGSGANHQSRVQLTCSCTHPPANLTAPPAHDRPTGAGRYTTGTGLLGYANRGLGSEGLFLEGGRDYEGYFFAKSSAGVDITVQFHDYTTDPPTVLATQTHAFAGGNNWTRVNFTLTPDVGTTCVDGTNDPAGVVVSQSH